MSNDEWQSEQMRYPRDADYYGAKCGTFDLNRKQDGTSRTWAVSAGSAFVYLFRRFGYPRFGWDDQKQIVQYHLTTPMEGVFLTVEPNVAGAGTFGYLLRDDINQACMEEEQKPYEGWTDQFEAWTLKEHDIEIVRLFDQDNDKLNRMWQKWGADKDPSDFASERGAENAFFTDQEVIRAKYGKMYMEIAPFPETIAIKDRPDDSIIKQCYYALCAAIEDMRRPVYVRDVMIDITGELIWDESNEHVMSAVNYAIGSGCGVGGKLDIDGEVV